MLGRGRRGVWEGVGRLGFRLRREGAWVEEGVDRLSLSLEEGEGVGVEGRRLQMVVEGRVVRMMVGAEGVAVGRSRFGSHLRLCWEKLEVVVVVGCLWVPCYLSAAEAEEDRLRKAYSLLVEVEVPKGCDSR